MSGLLRQQGSLKTACGTRDFSPVEAQFRERMIADLQSTFKRYNAVPLETPTFERKEYLMKKYGDDTKLIYEISQSSPATKESSPATKESSATENADDQKEALCLRYDLTVPLARYLVQNGVKKLRRYQIGKVYRRDLPNISKGRYREFYQADIDFIGEPETMLPEVQLLLIGCEILKKYQIPFEIKYNFRNNLTSILTLSEVPSDLVLTTCSTLDKLDKKPWDELIPEFKHKGLSETQITAIKYLLDNCYQSEDTVVKNTKFQEYSKIMDIDQYLSYTPTLARGMDYYTGLIFEFVIPSSPELGTVIAGGRYDNLCQMFKDGADLPAIGLSVGFERIFDYLNSKLNVRNSVQLMTYYVAMVAKGADAETLAKLTAYKLMIYKELLSYPIRAILDTEENCPLSRQIDTALKSGANYLIFVGGQELKNNQVTIKNLSERQQKTVSLDEFKDWVQVSILNIV